MKIEKKENIEKAIKKLTKMAGKDYCKLQIEYSYYKNYNSQNLLYNVYIIRKNECYKGEGRNITEAFRNLKKEIKNNEIHR